jgi:hypothetical protein
MSRGNLRDVLRKEEKRGYKRALGVFKNSDRIFYGNQQLLRDKTITDKLTILGDDILIASNYFEHKDTALEIM